MGIPRETIRQRIVASFQTDYGNDPQAWLEANLDAVIDEVLQELLHDALKENIRTVLLANRAFQDILGRVTRIE